MVLSSAISVMAWIQIRFPVEAGQSQTFEDLLLAIGAKAVSLLEPKDQPLYEKLPYSYPMWDKPIMVGLFTSDQPVAERADQLAQFYREETGTAFPEYQIEILEDKVWETAWADDFKPMQFGERLWVFPTSHEGDIPENTIALKLDPGLAFGTGTHPTTRLCLQWLDHTDIKGKSVCDYGCGSGILGIAALKLGATELTAVDIDPKALTETELNAKRNQVSHENYKLLLPEEQPVEQYELVIANILAGPLLELADRLQAMTASGGQLLLSGILEKQAQEVMNQYQHWFDLLPYTQDDGWVRIEGRKRT